MLVVKDVSKRYGDFTALQQYQFGIQHGSLWIACSEWGRENDADQNVGDFNYAERRGNPL